MIHLAVLIANPRQEVRAADLVAGLAGLSRASGDDGPAQAVLDHEAIAEYRDHLKRLDAELGQPDRVMIPGGWPGPRPNVTGLSPSWPLRRGSAVAPGPSPIRGNGRG